MSNTRSIFSASNHLPLLLALSSLLPIPALAEDTTAPVLAAVWNIKSFTNDTTPNYVFSSTEGGTMVYGGACNSTNIIVPSPIAPALVFTKTITFNALPDGTYSNCTIKVRDASGNLSAPLSVKAFTVDTTTPILTQVVPIPSTTSNYKPVYKFSSSKAGTIIYSGDCSSATINVSAGNNSITMNTLSPGLHDNCSIKVTDLAGNQSTALAIPAFTVIVDTMAPVLTAVWNIKSFTNDTTPNYVFSSTEGGTIVFGGACNSTNTIVPSPIAPALVFTKTITFNALPDGTYNNCTIKVRDASGNLSSALAVNPFTVDTVTPLVDEIKPVATPAIDNKPVYIFASSEAGTITYDGDCSSPTFKAVTGNNIISFRTLTTGLHDNCTIRVNDAAGNQSSVLSIASFTVAEIASKPLNDTGASLCGDYAYIINGYSDSWQFLLDCAANGASIVSSGTDGQGDPVPAGQDAVNGRDANLATNSNDNGLAGFSFTKLNAAGNALAIQNGVWSDSGNEIDGTQWSCVQDNVTGLIWEVKSNAGGLRDKDWTYAWYNPDITRNGGYAGEPDAGNGIGSDNCANSARCDTNKYVIDVNAVELCGETANDWRMPTIDELYSLVAKNNYAPAIDYAYFPDTGSGNRFWSSSPASSNPATAWYLNNLNGSDGSTTKTSANYVRLVREVN